MGEKTDRIHSYKDLVVWQRSMELVVSVYELTEQYPSEEKFGLVAHTRKTAISIPSNIAEGKARSTRKDYRQFLVRAYSSGAELETQIEIAKRLSFGKEIDFSDTEALLGEVMRMLNTMIIKLGTEN